VSSLPASVASDGKADVDLTEWTWVVWLSLALIFIIIELFTLEFTFAMLAAGSLVGGLGMTLLGGPWWLQILVAAALSALLLFLIRPLLVRMLRRSEDRTRHNIDAVPQQFARALGEFSEGRGTVKLENGETWSAVFAADVTDQTARDGDRVIVTRVIGATVEVRPITEAQGS